MHSRLVQAGLIASTLLPLCAHAAEKEQRLAIVNVSLVFEKYDRVTDADRRIKVIFSGEMDVLTRRADELRTRNQSLQERFNAQSDELFNEVQKLRREQYFYEKELDKLNRQIQKEYTKEMREILSDIRTCIRTVAQKGSFDMVLRSPDSDDPEVKSDSGKDPAAADQTTLLQRMEPKTMGELLLRFNRNPVLYGTRTVDITQAVLEKLNTDFSKRSGLQPTRTK